MTITKGMPQPSLMVTILGDSRAFDTYFTNATYSERYGYDATFPHLLRRMALEAAPQPFDVVHIPDHFRGGTVENNVIRLALTDPTIVVLCDGIWETLVHKDWFVEWATARIRAHPTHSTETLDLSFSSRRLADLFIADELPVSPRKYAAKQVRIISYFRRRRRQCVWMSLPMPPRDHLNRVHYAGNYKCIPEWGECLAAVNAAMAPVVSAYEAVWLDLHQLALDHGGIARALIDQWHFSRTFHAAIATELGRMLPSLAAQNALPTDHISRAFLLSRPLENETVSLLGAADAITRWRTDNPAVNVEAAIGAFGNGRTPAGIRVVPLADAARLASRCVVCVDPAGLTPADEARLLGALSRDAILLYPHELGAIVNPPGTDRAEHGRLR